MENPTKMENDSLPVKTGIPDPVDARPKGIGGWLAFLIILLMIVEPLANIIMTIQHFSAQEASMPGISNMPAFIGFRWFYWGVISVCSAFNLLAGYALWKKHQWRSVRFAIAVLWLIGPASCLVIELYLHMLFGSGVWRYFVSENAFFFIKSFLLAALWTAYLLKSKRVANTYVRKPVRSS